MKSMRIRWVGHFNIKREIESISIGNLKERDYLADLFVDGTIII
jgi:hypothetical protein